MVYGTTRSPSDYRTSESNDRTDLVQCLCGSENCRKIHGDIICSQSWLSVMGDFTPHHKLFKIDSMMGLNAFSAVQFCRNSSEYCYGLSIVSAHNMVWIQLNIYVSWWSHKPHHIGIVSLYHNLGIVSLYCKNNLYSLICKYESEFVLHFGGCLTVGMRHKQKRDLHRNFGYLLVSIFQYTTVLNNSALTH